MFKKHKTPKDKFQKEYGYCYNKYQELIKEELEKEKEKIDMTNMQDITPRDIVEYIKSGDYVETVSGVTGYLLGLSYDKWKCQYEFEFMRSDNLRRVDCIGSDDKLSKTYKRIGVYDFTEPKQPEKPKKIDTLSYCRVEKRKSTRVEVTSSDYPNSQPVVHNNEMNNVIIKTDTKDVIDKLNEVINRVNEIGGKE